MKNHTFHKNQHKFMAPEIIHDFAQIVAQVIKNKVANGMTLQKATKETFDELNLINKVIQKLALHYINLSKSTPSTPSFKSLNYRHNLLIIWGMGIIFGIFFVLIIVMFIRGVI